MAEALEEAEARLAAFRQFLLPRIFQYLPPPLAGAVCVLLGCRLAAHWGFETAGYAIGGGAAAVLLGSAVRDSPGQQAPASERAAIALAEAVVKADRLYEAVRHARERRRTRRRSRAIQAEYERTHAEISRAMEPGGRDRDANTRRRAKAKIEAQTPRLLATNPRAGDAEGGAARGRAADAS